MKNDKLFYFMVGFSIAIMVSMVVVACMPSYQPDFKCGGCGSPHWYSQEASDKSRRYYENYDR